MYIFLDEIQEVNAWERAVALLHESLDCDIYITGSSTKLLSGELAALLAGRYVEIRVYPLDLEEYLSFAAANGEEKNLSQQEHFANYLHFGGLPGIHLMKWDGGRIMQYLHDVYSSVLLRDVIARNKIRDTALLESIVLYLMDNVGNTFSAKTISDYLKNSGRRLSTEMVYTYLHALESACLVYKVPRFDIRGGRTLETQDKFYLVDLGLRYAVRGVRDDDISGTLENAVYLQLLRRGGSVNIGKQDTLEVDFVANREDERIYIQVCHVLTPENMEQEFRPLEAISDNYEKVVLSTDTLRVNRGGIRQKNIIDFLLTP